MVTAYIGIGSNLGRRKNNLKKAIEEISARHRIISKSAIYETEPVGKIKQNHFYNCVIAIETEVPPRRLLKTLKSIEKLMGRKHEVKWGPRNIDLDLLACGEAIVNKDGLSVPHPEMHRRKFVLVPLRDIAGDFVHPATGESVGEMLRKAPEILTRKLK